MDPCRFVTLFNAFNIVASNANQLQNEMVQQGLWTMDTVYVTAVQDVQTGNQWLSSLMEA